MLSTRMVAPTERRGATASSIACMIAGTPAMAMTFSTMKPGAFEIGFSISSAPDGIRAMRRRAAFSSPSA